MKSVKSLPSRQPQRGASLIEVLVSLLVLTIGVLSMVALHAASLRYGKMAEFKSTASQLAEDLGDRMRSNIVGARNGNYVRATSWTDNVGYQSVPAIATCTATDGSCAAVVAQSVAQRDLVEWFNQAYPNLPGVGLFTQQVGNAGSSVMDVWVGWLEPSGNGGADAAAEAAINAAFVCPAAMTTNANVRCMRFRFSL